MVNQRTEKNDWQLLFLCALFLFVSFLPSANYPKLPFFILSGTFSGWFYGKHNNQIWAPRSNPKPYEDVHNYWVHIFAGIVGGIVAYILSSRINFYNPSETLARLGGVELILFLIMLLSYTGYIPRILWYIANTGKLLEELLKR